MGTTTNSEAFRFASGLITQLDRNQLDQLDPGSNDRQFDFLPNSQWLSMGRFTTPNQTLYGYRAQSAGRGLLMGFKGLPQTSLTSLPTAGSAVIEWVGDGGVSSGDLTFATSNSSTSAAPRQVLRLLQNASCVLAENSVFAPGGSQFNAGFTPKLEISAVNSQQALYVGTISSLRTASFVNNSFAGRSVTGVEVITNGLALNSSTVGLDVTARAFNTSGPNRSNTGIKCSAGGGDEENTGILSVVNSVTNSLNASRNYGIKITANASSGVSNYGLYSNLVGNTSSSFSMNYGIYSTATGTEAFAGYFDGRIFSTEHLIVSDISLKQTINTETDMLTKLKDLRPVNYMFKQDKQKTGLHLPANLQHGFIAQELEKVFPELVSQITNPIFDDTNNLVDKKQIKAVNYTGLISVLVVAINELNAEFETFKAQNQNQNQTKTVVIDNLGKLSKTEQDRLIANSYSLEQNSPNPFSELTTINYVLPQDERNASILLLNLAS